MSSIHTVAPRETLWGISLIYKVPYQTIAQANRIQPPYTLVIGQSLFIPSVAARHTVSPGESLWSISRQYGVSVDALSDVNNISPSGIIYPGQVLVIPSESKRFGRIESNAYIEPVGSLSEEIAEVLDVNNYLTYLSIFSYRVTETGALIPPPNSNAIARASRNGGTAPLMVLTNFRGGTFDSDLANVILNNPQIQQTLFNNIETTLRENNFFGINVDFERVRGQDRDLYTGFLRRLRDRLKPQGYSLSAALAPKTSASQVGDWYEGHDYGGVGSVVDFVILMTYEWGWSGGPPLPVAPINEVKKVLDYAVREIPRNKIMMGMPLYGYDWTLPYIPKSQFARRIGPATAVDRAKRYGSNIHFDATSQSPYFYYYDERGNRHIVWFEDARSVYQKFKVVHDYGLRGVSYWVLGLDFPQNWLLLEDLFNIRKIV